MPRAIATFKCFVRPQANVQALVAGLTRVLRWHGNYLNSSLDSLVLQKESKLKKCPTVGTSPLCSASGLSVGSVAYTSQILNGNNCFLRLSLLDDGSADIVVEPRLKSLFLPRQPFQQLATSTPTTTCAFRGAFLNRSSSLGKFISNFLDGLSVPLIPVGGNGNTPSSEVNSDNVVGFNWVRYFVRQLDVDVVESIPMLGKSSRSWLSSFKLADLVVTHLHRNVFPSTYQSQTNRPILLSKRKNPSIIVSRCGLECSDGLAFDFSSLAVSGNSGANSDRQVSCQTKLLPQLLVGLGLDGYFVSYVWLDYLIDIVATIRKRFQGCLNFGNLLRRGMELADQCQSLFHLTILSLSEVKIKVTGLVRSGRTDLRGLTSSSYLKKEASVNPLKLPLIR